MNIVSGILVYVILWWLIFFMALPIGYRVLAEAEPGIQAGAPESPHLWLKAGITTLITSLIFLCLCLYIPADMLQWSYFKG